MNWNRAVILIGLLAPVVLLILGTERMTELDLGSGRLRRTRRIAWIPFSHIEETDVSRWARSGTNKWRAGAEDWRTIHYKPLMNFRTYCFEYGGAFGQIQAASRGFGPEGYLSSTDEQRALIAQGMLRLWSRGRGTGGVYAFLGALFDGDTLDEQGIQLALQAAMLE